MRFRDKSGETKGTEFKIKYLIGYTVNGSQNGVWLAGNSAVCEEVSSTSVSWGHKHWYLNYVATWAKANEGQLHDAHTETSRSVCKRLIKIAEKINVYPCICELCQEINGPEISPPYFNPAI